MPKTTECLSLLLLLLGPTAGCAFQPTSAPQTNLPNSELFLDFSSSRLPDDGNAQAALVPESISPPEFSAAVKNEEQRINLFLERFFALNPKFSEGQRQLWRDRFIDPGKAFLGIAKQAQLEAILNEQTGNAQKMVENLETAAAAYYAAYQETAQVTPNPDGSIATEHSAEITKNLLRVFWLIDYYSVKYPLIANSWSPEILAIRDQLYQNPDTIGPLTEIIQNSVENQHSVNSAQSFDATDRAFKRRFAFLNDYYEAICRDPNNLDINQPIPFIDPEELEKIFPLFKQTVDYLKQQNIDSDENRSLYFRRVLIYYFIERSSLESTVNIVLTNVFDDEKYWEMIQTDLNNKTMVWQELGRSAMDINQYENLIFQHLMSFFVTVEHGGDFEPYYRAEIAQILTQNPRLMDSYRMQPLTDEMLIQLGEQLRPLSANDLAVFGLTKENIQAFFNPDGSFNLEAMRSFIANSPVSDQILAQTMADSIMKSYHRQFETTVVSPTTQPVHVVYEFKLDGKTWTIDRVFSSSPTPLVDFLPITSLDQINLPGMRPSKKIEALAIENGMKITTYLNGLSWGLENGVDLNRLSFDGIVEVLGFVTLSDKDGAKTMLAVRANRFVDLKMQPMVILLDPTNLDSALGNTVPKVLIPEVLIPDENSQIPISNGQITYYQPTFEQLLGNCGPEIIGGMTHYSGFLSSELPGMPIGKHGESFNHLLADWISNQTSPDYQNITQTWAQLMALANSYSQLDGLVMAATPTDISLEADPAEIHQFPVTLVIYNPLTKQKDIIDLGKTPYLPLFTQIGGINIHTLGIIDDDTQVIWKAQIGEENPDRTYVFLTVPKKNSQGNPLIQIMEYDHQQASPTTALLVLATTLLPPIPGVSSLGLDNSTIALLLLMGAYSHQTSLPIN